MKLKSLLFRAGAAPGADPLKLDVQPMVVFVGPNNAGKSLALGDIEDILTNPTSRLQDQVIASLVAEVPGHKGMREALEPFRLQSDEADVQVERYIIPRPVGGALDLGVNWAGLQERLPDETHLLDSGSGDLVEHMRWDWQAQHYGQAVTASLGGRQRLTLLDAAAPLKPGQGRKVSFIQSLFYRLDHLKEARKIIARAIHLYITIDATSLVMLYARLSPRPPEDDDEEQSMSPRARAFHNRARQLQDYGDGIVAFVGIVCAAVSDHHRVLLIDEPEAFLHPPLVRRLAASLSEVAANRGKTIVVATHSSEVLLGCVSAGRPFSLVRLTFERGEATARTLDDELVRTITLNPLLRSTGCLAALFHRAAVIVESGTDRAFYSEINDRLLGVSRGVAECVFVEGNGKQSLWPVVRALRSLGVPAAAIVDIDVLKDGGGEWTKVLEAAFIPGDLHASLNSQRQGLMTAFGQSGKDMKKDGGVAVLPAGPGVLFEQLARTLAEYGIFVVRGGEVESWLKPLGATGHGPAWLAKVFEKMGSDRASRDYLVPADDDVWEFIDRIGAWVGNPARLGTP